MPSSPRYHLNPATGEPGVCRARKTCPFGDLVEDHYPTEEEARLAYERKALAFLLPRLSTSDLASSSPSPAEASPDTPSLPVPEAYVEDPSLLPTLRRRLQRVQEGTPRLRALTEDAPWRRVLQERGEELRSPLPGAPKTMKVLRAGSLTPSTPWGENAFNLALADALRPEGAPPRGGALFASLEGAGLARWMRGNQVYRRGEHLNPHEITVNPNEVFVYNVDAWEDFSWRDNHPDVWWSSRVRLSRFPALLQEEGLDPTEWEVLLPPTTVQAARPLGAQRLKTLLQAAEVSPSHQRELDTLMKGILRWRKTGDGQEVRRYR